MVDAYLIWSNQHQSWWRPRSQGYTRFARKAGVYSREDAIMFSHKGRDGWAEDGGIPDEIAVPIDSIPTDLRPKHTER